MSKEKLTDDQIAYSALISEFNALQHKYADICDSYKLCKDANETMKQNCAIYMKENAELKAENERLKLPEDSVVLTKGAYESLSSKAKANVVNAVEIRKETAEKILNAIYEKLNDSEAVYEVDYECYVDDVLYDLSKQFDVEIKE